jgi:hypothetical protein
MLDMPQRHHGFGKLLPSYVWRACSQALLLCYAFRFGIWKSLNNV